MSAKYKIEKHGCCQRCAKPVYCFNAPNLVPLLSYALDLPPDEEAKTCVACFSVREVAAVERVYGPHLVPKVMDLQLSARASEPS